MYQVQISQLNKCELLNAVILYEIQWIINMSDYDKNIRERKLDNGNLRFGLEAPLPTELLQPLIDRGWTDTDSFLTEFNNLIHFHGCGMMAVGGMYAENLNDSPDLANSQIILVIGEEIDTTKVDNVVEQCLQIELDLLNFNQHMLDSAINNDEERYRNSIQRSVSKRVVMVDKKPAIVPRFTGEHEKDIPLWENLLDNSLRTVLKSFKSTPAPTINNSYDNDDDDEIPAIGQSYAYASAFTMR